MSELPSGTVTLLFTDIEGSTRLVQQLGDTYGSVLDEHRWLLRKAVADWGGHEVDCRADELFAAFQRAKDAVEAAVAAQQTIRMHEWPQGAQVLVRMGLHTGEPAVEGGAYLGLDVSRAARICAAGHGAQILLSHATSELVADCAELRELGVYSLAGLPRPERIFQLNAPGLPSAFSELRAPLAERRRLRELLQARRTRQPTLEEAAWRVRAMLPGVEVALQKPLANLGAAFFTAHRAVASADSFLAHLDRKRLTHRLRDRREMAVVSHQAREQAESLEAQIAYVDRVPVLRQELAQLAAELPSENELNAGSRIASLQERVATATTELDDAVARAANALDPLSVKLGRTRHRGVYRSGLMYVVPFADELGEERSRRFETLAEARNFRQALRVTEKAQQDFAPRPFETVWKAAERDWFPDIPDGPDGRKPLRNPGDTVN